MKATLTLKAKPSISGDLMKFLSNVQYAVLAFILSILFLLPSCGGGDDESNSATDVVDDGSDGEDCGTPEYASTFAAIQGEIFEEYGCTNSACHGSSPGSGNLDLTADNAYDQLVGVASSNSTMDRVDPGHHESSYLFEKLEAKVDSSVSTTGSPMPAGGFSALTEDHLEALHLWIDGGATEELVVAGTAELLSSCLPQASSLKIDVPDAPEAGVGVQMQSTAWSLPHDSENEVCLATYYDFTQTELIAEDQQFDCVGLADANNPSGKCFRVHKKVLAQDLLSHHSIVYLYTGVTGVLDDSISSRQFGPFTYKANAPDDPDNGVSCDPTVVDAATGFHQDCSGAVNDGCIIYGPQDYDFRNRIRFSGTQSSYNEAEFADGVYFELPMSGVVVWNSHAFNLSETDSTMAKYLNLELAAEEDQLYPAIEIFELGSVFSINVAPFVAEEICTTVTVEQGARLFTLSSHAHKRSTQWRIWEPPNTPCLAGEEACVAGPDERQIYLSNDYSDPVYLEYDTPVALDSANEEDRTYLSCVVIDNGSTESSPAVKQQSTSVEVPFPNLPGGPCADETVACMAGPNKGQLCGGVDSVCDDSPGDGQCDACPVRGGFTSDDEMFLPLGTYYLETN